MARQLARRGFQPVVVGGGAHRLNALYWKTISDFKWTSYNWGLLAL